MSTLDVSVAFCHRRNPGETQHWMFILAIPGSTTGTWYHVTGGPTLQAGYTLHIQAGKRLDSFGIASRTVLCQISANDINKVRAAAQAVPLQRCQRWTVALLDRLEQRGLVPLGTKVRFESQIEPSPHEQRSSGGSQAGGGNGSNHLGSRSASSYPSSGTRSSYFPSRS
ncbi:hypothetical protein EMCG_09576 [[Emmonsia] crescens]|uniref:Uncharacterized protein n=1 Tax=[Emmonsia] crescens TaxID=73230 RepID=A0A0G2J9R5_9EURO|nr:hypothetical protein EMCG_09576 [Emmonsia crescens UAMH 3008]